MKAQIKTTRNSVLMGTALTLLLGLPFLAQAGSGDGHRDFRSNGDRYESRGNGDSFASKEFDWADNMGPEDGYGSQNPREFYRGRSDRDRHSDRFDRNNYRQGNEDIDGIIAIYGYETDPRSTRRGHSGRGNDSYARDYDPYGKDWDTGEARDTEERYYTDQYGDVDTMWEEYDYGGDFDFRSADDGDYPENARYRSRGHYRDPEAFWDAQPYVSPDTYRYDDNRSRDYRRDYRY